LDLILKAIWGITFDTGFALSCVWLMSLGGAALLADVLPLGEHKDVSAAVLNPIYQPPDLFSDHPLGTNNVGLDILARCIYGARVSLLVAGFTVALILVIGGLIGLVAGYFRGKVDGVVGVVTDTVLAIPGLIVLIALSTVLGRPTSVTDAVVKTTLGLTIIGLPTMVRLSRANTMNFAQREFVLAARGMGATSKRVLLAELAPNVAIPLLSFAAVIAALFILAEGSLSFLGLGLRQPEPTWGNMIAEGQRADVLRESPFIALVPGTFMFLTIFAFNRVGEHFRGVGR
jgi:peptide/nickel transport system permease protein